MIIHALYLLWTAFILSAGAACGFVAWKTWRLRSQHRIFRYFGFAMTALCASTVNTGYGIVSLIRAGGLATFDSLTLAQHRGLIASTVLAVTLWLLALYLLNKIN